MGDSGVVVNSISPNFVLLARLLALFLRAAEQRAATIVAHCPPGADGVARREVLPDLPCSLGWG